MVKDFTRERPDINALRITIVDLQAQLAAARRPVPDPATPTPFLEMVTVGNFGNATDAGDASEPSVSRSKLLEGLRRG